MSCHPNQSFRPLSIPLISIAAGLLAAGCLAPVAPPEHVVVRPVDVGMEHDVVPGASVAPHGWEEGAPGAPAESETEEEGSAGDGPVADPAAADDAASAGEPPPGP